MISHPFYRRILMLTPVCTLFFALFLAGCGDNGEPAGNYPATILEGRTAVEDMLQQTGASSISVAFVADNRIVWSEAFGFADIESGALSTPETMYGIGSVSKMIAAIAVMILVDRNEISLDMPVRNYVPSFQMLSPEYCQVTVKMLLNHSSGFPGSDLRNSFTATPYPDYARQLLDTLSEQRLKHAPGFINTYCNDGFSMIENLIESVTGKSYVQFVHDEILAPLEMTHSRYSLEAFPAGSFARTYTGEAADPQAFVNLYAAGGLYSTPSDMSKVLLMILNSGYSGGIPILSGSAIEEMAKDQTEGTFNPAPSGNESFGLGWDTVSQPGMKAAGVKAWAKGGDTPTYGSAFIALPDEKMGVIVSGASNFSSGNAMVIGERILLRALLERGRINDFPVPLPEIPKPLRTPTPQDLASITGHYAKNNNLMRIDANEDGSLTFRLFAGTAWMPYLDDLQLRDNGWFSTDALPLLEFSTISADGRTYLVLRDAYGNRHYQDDTLFMQKIGPLEEPLSTAWSDRLQKSWLLVNGNPESLLPTNTEPRLSFFEPEGLEGLIAVDTCDGFSIVDPSGSDDMGTMLLLMPQGGRDLNDAFIIPRDDREWVRFGSFLYRPSDSVPILSAPAETITIGREGYSEWRSIQSDGSAVSVTVESNGVWKLFNPDMEWMFTRKGSDAVILPAARGSYFFMSYGSPGESMRVSIASAE
jgi:CubicO group peptidase (beta-lactamase class C family)